MDVMENVLTVCAVLSNMLMAVNIWLLLKIFFGCDLRLTKRNMILSASLFLIFNVGMSFLFYFIGEEYATLQTFLAFLYILLGAVVLAEHKRFKVLLFTLPALLLYVMYTDLAVILDTLSGLERFAFVYEEQSFTPIGAISDLLIFILLLLILRKVERQKWSLTLTVGEGIAVLVFCLLFFFLRNVFDTYSEQDGNYFLKVSGCFILLVLNIVGGYAIIHRKLAGYYKSVSQNYKEQFEEEYSYFQEYKDKQQDTVRFRHDWRNHILVLQNMLQQGEYTRAGEYFEGLSGKTGMTAQKILTGNEMLDMLLCIKEQECSEAQIQVSMEGTLSGLSFLNPVDGSILFSNLLDNAIEANQQVSAGRFIRIRGKTVNETLYFEMENPMKGELKYEGAQLVTTKEDSDAHGLGLQNISKVLKKYQGQSHIDVRENIFTIQIIFPAGE